MTIKESDWKIFKGVRKKALERFCQRILDECQAIMQDNSRSAHERYLEIFQLIQERDIDIANAFDQFSRSSAAICLYRMRIHNLLTDEEISEFSEDFQHMTEPEK